MTKCKNGKHKFVARFHTRECVRCGHIERAETCADSFRVKEPAGVRNLQCGHFTFDPRASLRALWDQYRLALAFHPDSYKHIVEFRPPAWFKRQVC